MIEDRPVQDPARRGDWMQTYTGRAFWPLDPRPEEVDPVDVAHALAHLCRYGGHVRRFYSVAEHCVLMSLAVTPENALAALLHDATEAYLVDLPRPIKRHMPGYRDAEAVLWRAVAARFGLPEELPAEVHEADSRILVNERDALMAPPPRTWGLEHLEPLPLSRIVGWSPPLAERFYLARLEALTGRTYL